MNAYQCANCHHVQEPVDGKCPFCGTPGPPQDQSAHLKRAKEEIDMLPEGKHVMYTTDGTRHEYDPNLDRD